MRKLMRGTTARSHQRVDAGLNQQGITNKRPCGTRRELFAPPRAKYPLWTGVESSQIISSNTSPGKYINERPLIASGLIADLPAGDRSPRRAVKPT